MDSPLRSEKGLWYLHTMYGASLGNPFLFAGKPDFYDKLVISEVEKLHYINGLSELLLFSWWRTTDNHPLLVTTGPSPTNRAQPERKIDSPYILQQFCKRTFEYRYYTKPFYDTLHTASTTSSAPVVFDCRAHHFLQERRTLNLFPILAPSKPKARTHFEYVYYKYISGVTRRRKFRLPKLKECLVDDKTTQTH